MNTEDTFVPETDYEPQQAILASLESEQALIGALLLDNGAFDRVRDISPQDFSSPDLAEVFAVVKRMIETNRPADVVTVSVELGGLGQWAHLLNTLVMCIPSANNIGTYAASIVEKARHRAAVKAAADAYYAALKATSADDAIEALAAGLEASPKARHGKAIWTMVEAITARGDYLERLERGEVAPGIPTGLPDLDRKLCGGFKTGDVIILAARPAVGKSSLAQQIATHAAGHGYPALILSQEMTVNELADRQLAVHGAATDQVKRGKGGNDEFWASYTKAATEAEGLPLHLCDQAALTVAQIRAKCRSIKGLKLVVLDYLQLCSGDSRPGANRNAEVEQISRGLKVMAKDLGLAVLALSQLNREVEKRPGKKPVMSDIRDSGSIEQDAGVILMLWPIGEDGGDKRGLGVVKNRHGATGEIALKFDGAHHRWWCIEGGIAAVAPVKTDRGLV